MRLRTWMLGGYGIVLVVAVVGLSLGLIAAVNLADISGRMVEENFAAVESAARVRRLANEEQVTFTRLADADAPAIATRLEAFAREARLLAAAARAASRNDAAATRSLERVDTALDTLESHAGALAALPAWTQPDADERSAIFNEIEDVRSHAFDFYRLRYDDMVARGTTLKTQSTRLAWALGLLAICTLVVGIWASVRIAGRLVRPMEHLVRASDRVATGDFTVRTARSGLAEPDRVAQRFDEMVAALERFHAMNLDRIVAERRRLDEVVANIDDGLVIFDDTGVVERINPVAARQLGLTPTGALGRRAEQLVAMPTLADDVSRLLAHPGDGPTAAADLNVESEGTRRTLSCSLLPFSDSARLGLILMLRDVTEQRRFEHMRTDFILRASHELRTPITGMRMAIGLLRDKVQFGPDYPREHELFVTLQQETERLVALITELFELSRLYANSDQRVLAAADPLDLMRGAHARHEREAADAGVHLDLQLPATLPSLQLDVDAMERVLDNLVSNALRHTPAGGQVLLGADATGEHVGLWVQDTGEGIPATERGRVFEPFMQLAGAKVGGVGLGLAMCREVVHRHGGRMQLDSIVGQGSRFTLCLPIT